MLSEKQNSALRTQNCALRPPAAVILYKSIDTKMVMYTKLLEFYDNHVIA